MLHVWDVLSGMQLRQKPQGGACSLVLLLSGATVSRPEELPLVRALLRCDGGADDAGGVERAAGP